MAFILGSLAIAALLALLVLGRRPARKSAGRPGSRQDGKRSPEPYRGVEIVPGLDACEHAAQLVGARFLLSNPPPLPLPNCTLRRCNCAFKKLSDRREDTRRWSDHGVEPTVYAGRERRQLHSERRKETS